MAAPADGSSATSVIEIAEPTPGPGEVAIAVDYAGINFLDVMARRGDPNYVAAWPHAPGLEVAGTVHAVGDGVEKLGIGDRVAALTAGGGFAEVALAPAELAVAVPPSVPLHLAAAAPLVVTSAVLLLYNVARIRPGESVVMLSASGGLGSAVAQVAAALGAASRIGAVGSPDKLAAALDAGWREAVAYGPAAAATVRELVPAGIDVVLDPTGTQNLDFDLQIAAPGARVVLFGNPGGGAPGALPPLGRLIGGNLGILGFSVSNLRRAQPAAVAGALQRSLALLANRAVSMSVSVVDGLRAVPAVHDLLAARRGHGKYVARVGGEDVQTPG
jgi:NADPH2:quinone reductase